MMKRFLHSLLIPYVIFFSLSPANFFAQTTIISPTGDGGFETGSTFASNGWTATTGSVNPLNQWICGTGATIGFTETRSAYITRNATLVHEYNNRMNSVSHLYRNITIPAGQTLINLNFNWICDGETSFDKMRIWIVPTSFTPEYGTSLTASGTAPTGNIQVGLANYSEQLTWTAATTVSIPAAFAGTTVRLVFEWTNDDSIVNDPPAAIDNISLTSQAPVVCAATPSALNSNSVTATTANITWTAASPPPSNGYQYYYNTTGIAPMGGQSGSVGAGIITAALSGLNPNTQYYFWVRSFCGGTQWSAWIGSGTFTTAILPATIPYIQDFSTTNDFKFINGTQTNKWAYGSASGNPVKSIYISNDGGTTNAYNTGSTSVVQAYRDIAIPAGTTIASFSFDWKSYGESNYDYFRVWLVPISFNPTAGTQITTGGGRIQIGGGNFELQASWQNYSNPALNLSAFANTTMRLVYEWRNDGSVGTPSPAAIDNISLTIPACPGLPTALQTSAITTTAAVISWSAASPAPASGYEYYYNTTGIPPTGGASGSVGAGVLSANLSGLTPNTTYYFWVRSNCNGTDKSAWVSGGSFYTGYCIPSSTSAATYIESFSTTGGVSNISNLKSGYATNGYQDNYNTQTVSSYPNIPIDFSLDLVGGTAGVAIWVDWNNNLVFELSERVYTSNSYLPSGPTSGGFAIPASAATGNYRMRVRTDWLSENPDPCDNSNARTEAEDYKLTVLVLPTCTGTPINGTTVLNPTLGLPSSTFNASVKGVPPASGYTYQWQSAPSPSGPWSDISGATAATANINAASTMTTTYYRRKITCGSNSNYSTAVPFTTSNCLPTTNRPPNLYINKVEFIGNLSNPPVNISTYSASGFQDFTGNQPLIQADGSVVNINATVSGTILGRGTWKAWVDWNNDGDFTDVGELVYSIYGYVASDVNFGFIIPAGKAPGNYRLRLRTSSFLSGGNEFLGSDFGPCDPFNSSNNNNGDFGETEDYVFTVKYNCPARITAINTNALDGHRCGTGTVNLSATGTGEILWYDSPTAENLLGGGANFTTPVLTSTTTFYVAASNGSCESVFRTPVVARIDPAPEVTVVKTANSICGDEVSSFKVTSSGDKHEETLFSENFNAGLGVFVNDPAGAYTNAYGQWTNRPSPYVPANPPYPIFKPALSSGYYNGDFAAIITDVIRNNNVRNHLKTNSYNTTGYINLKLDFDLYYYSISSDVNDAYFKVDYSINGGSNWNNLSTITTNQGNPNIWSRQEITLPTNALNSTSFMLRFTVYSYADGNGWYGNMATIDNVRIYGDKPITTAFSWTGDTSILYDATCANQLTGASNSVCIKPSSTQIQDDSSWTITATAAFNNGCPATKSITIYNDTKTWNPDIVTTNWTDAKWKPTTGVPDEFKCVIVKKPVTLGTSTSGLAKNLTVQGSGDLTIAGNLTVIDFIKNNTLAEKFIVESDANLLQKNDAATNTGAITVKRKANLKRLDYNYWAAPVSGQNLKQFSPGTLNNRFYTYDESDDFFDVIDPVANNFADNGKGYAIRAYNTYGTTTQVFSGKFIGIPNNGIKSINLAFTDAAHGYNLIGNPYSSNLNFYTLFQNNNLLIYNTSWFWTNINPNPPMQGSGYPGTGIINNYAVLNGTGGVPATDVLGTATVPNEFLKVGQGFIVKAKASGTLNFKNQFRTLDNTGNFYNRTEAQSDRFWLTLTTPLDVITTQLIGYKAEATNGFELDYDAPLLVLGADAFYSVLGNEKLAIQGKAPFVTTDIVQLGSSHYEAGNYTISLGNKEGIFSTGQNVYLKDVQTGIITNLSEGPYTFEAAQGLSEGRFQIIYRPQVVLATNGTNTEELVVYRTGNDFVVKAQSKKITRIDVYDTAGRMIYTLNSNATQVIVPADQLPNSIYILQISQSETSTSRKILK